VLKPGGTFSCYDWMKSGGEYSEDMLYWFEMEGLTFAMETLEKHGELLAEAGFREVELLDASDWYRREVRREYELLKGPLNRQVNELIGQKDADHLVEDWRAMMVVCEKGEMLQAYCRAKKPTQVKSRP
jgi:lysyl-tRNA synthetase class I